MTAEYYDGKTVKVASLNNQFEADVMRDMLAEQGIVAVFRPYEDMAYGDLFVPGKGWGGLWVPPEAEEQVIALLEEIRSGDWAEFDEEALAAAAMAAENAEEL